MLSSSWERRVACAVRARPPRRRARRSRAVAPAARACDRPLLRPRPRRVLGRAREGARGVYGWLVPVARQHRIRREHRPRGEPTARGWLCKRRLRGEGDATRVSHRAPAPSRPRLGSAGRVADDHRGSHPVAGDGHQPQHARDQLVFDPRFGGDRRRGRCRERHGGRAGPRGARGQDRARRGRRRPAVHGSGAEARGRRRAGLSHARVHEARDQSLVDPVLIHPAGYGAEGVGDAHLARRTRCAARRACQGARARARDGEDAAIPVGRADRRGRGARDGSSGRTLRVQCPCAGARGE